MLLVYGTETNDKVEIKISFEGKPTESDYILTIDKNNESVSLTGGADVEDTPAGEPEEDPEEPVEDPTEE